MLKLGDLWIELWQLSDVTLFILTSACISNLLICVLYWSRRCLEYSMSKYQINRLLKFILLYILILMPIITAVSMYKGIFVHVGPFQGEDGLDTIRITKARSISYSTPHGNHGIFWILMAVWLAGFLWCGLRSYWKKRLVLKRVKKMSHICEEKELLRIQKEVEEELGIKKSRVLWISDLVNSPFVTGAVRSEIFLPQGMPVSEEIRLVLYHENIHCKKRDPLYRNMLFLICALYWFNPFMRLLTEYYVEINEMACDEMVLENQTKKDRYVYAKALASMRQNGGFLSDAVSLTGHTKSQLERRLENMMRKNTGMNKVAFAAVALILVLICPITSYAASMGTIKIQDAIAGQFIEEYEEVLVSGNTLVEETDNLGKIKMAASGIQVQPRGTTVVDVELNGQELVSLGEVTVSANSMITVTLVADSDTASFRAGYIDASGSRTYVTTSDGSLFHQFSIVKAGTYELFVEGRTSATLHIKGSIIVK